MKTGKSLSQLAAEIERQASAKRDFVSPVGKIAMSYDASGGVALNLGSAPGLEIGDTAALAIHQPRALLGLAHQQLGEYVNIPAKYYDRMLAEDPHLLATNVNRWLMKEALEKPKAARLVRTLDGKVRAFLSDRYRPLENFDLATAVLPVLQSLDLEILSSEVTERRLYIKAADKRIMRDIPSGAKNGEGHVIYDTCAPAIVVSNSEVGCGALSVETAVYTKRCTNLAIFGERSMRKYHTGARSAIGDGVYEMLTDDTKRLTDQAVWSQVRDIVAAAFDQARFDASLEAVKEMSEQKIEGDVVKAVEVARVHFGMTKDEGSSILKHLISGGDLSRYGLFNAVTRTAEDLPEYERATEFERAGGQVIELPRNDWERIAKAA